MRTTVTHPHRPGGTTSIEVPPPLRTTVSGVLKGAGGVVVSATTGVDYVSPSDERLSDSRTPTSHTHPNTEVTGLGGAAVLGVGTSEGTVCAGDDSRLTNSRTPTAHASTHAPGGTDELTSDAVAGTASLRTLGTGAQQACAGNDSRLSDARTPVSHTHPASEVSDSTATGRSVIKAASAVAGAAVLWPDNVIVGFPGIIKRRSYTVAELPAASTVGAGAEAYCTDCLTPNGTGGYVQSDGSKWRLFNGLEATTDVETYMLSGLSLGINLQSPYDTFVYDDFSSASVNARIALAYSNSGTGSAMYTTAGAANTGTSLILDTGTAAAPNRAAFITSLGDIGDILFAARVRFANLSDGTDSYWSIIGEQNQPSSSTTYPTIGAFFAYDSQGTNFGAATSANYRCVTASSGSTVTDSGVTPSTSATTPDRLRIFANRARTSVKFVINGTVVATHTTNIAAATFSYGGAVRMIRTAGTSANRYANVFYVHRSVRSASPKSLIV